MHKMPSPIQNRNKTYYLRYNIPKDLKKFTNRTCIKRSLESKDKAEAYRNAPDVWEKMKEELNALALQIKPSDTLSAVYISSICEVWLSNKIKEIELDQFVLLSWATENIRNPLKNLPSSKTNHVISSFIWNELFNPVSTLVFNDPSFIKDELNITSEMISTSPLKVQYALARYITQDERKGIIKRYGLHVVEGQQLDNSLARALIQCFIKLKQVALEREKGDRRYMPVYDDLKRSEELSIQVLGGEHRDETKPKLSTIITQWENKITRENGAKGKSRIEDYASAFQRLMLFLGDISIIDVTSEHVRSFRETLYNLPSSPSKELKLLPLSEQVTQGKLKNAKCLSNNTVRNNLVHLSALFTFAKNDKHIKENVIEGLLPSKTRKKRTVDHQEAYTREEIDLIFSQPLFTEQNYSEVLRSRSIEPHTFYWVPILCYYFGARLAEVCFRYKPQVFFSKQVNMYIFRIDESHGEASIKEAASARDLPIPQSVIDLGFLAFVESIADGQPLFAKRGTSQPMTKGTFGKAWGNYLRKIDGFELNGRQPSHAFRHTMEELMRNSGTRPDISRYIAGRAREESSEGYGGFIVSVQKTLKSVPPLELTTVKRQHKASSIENQ